PRLRFLIDDAGVAGFVTPSGPPAARAAPGLHLRPDPARGAPGPPPRPPGAIAPPARALVLSTSRARRPPPGGVTAPPDRVARRRVRRAPRGLRAGRDDAAAGAALVRRGHFRDRGRAPSRRAARRRARRAVLARALRLARARRAGRHRVPHARAVQPDRRRVV